MPSSSQALDQIASDLDAVATFVGDTSDRARLAQLLRDALDLADALDLERVAIHASLAVKTLNRRA